MGNITEWSGFGYVGATKQKTGGTGGNSLNLTQQWMEPNGDITLIRGLPLIGHKSILIVSVNVVVYRGNLLYRALIWVQLEGQT